jgi:hypothetical protein
VDKFKLVSRYSAEGLRKTTKTLAPLVLETQPHRDTCKEGRGPKMRLFRTYVHVNIFILLEK